MSDFKEFERDAWEKKAALYRETWGTASIQTIETVLDRANLSQGAKLLDCGCGPGDLCHAASERGATVIGCDYSTHMVKLAKSNYPNISFVHEDAENLTFADASFDAVTLNYLLLHVADQWKVLLEAKRVLRPQGQMVFALWMPPNASPGFSIIFQAIKKYADTSVIPPAQDLFLFANESYAKQYLTEVGFSNITTEQFPTYIEVKDADQFFSFIQSGTRIGGTIELQSSEIKEKIKNKISREIEQFKNNGSYILPIPSIIVSAIKRI